MDRATYYNAESGSTFSDDSYLSNPITSGRAKTSRGHVNASNVFQMRQKRQSRSSLIGQLNTEAVNKVDTTSRDQDAKQQYQSNSNYSIPKCHAAGAGARHIFHKKMGGSGGGLTRKILHSGISRVAIPCNKDRDEMEFQYGTVLVLHLQCKNIHTMTPGALDPFFNLKNLYLYKNNIRRIQGIEALCHLELLDLSRNNLERIDNLDKCRRLKKLYLGFNEIQVVEGLEGLNNLEELHIDDQDMPPEQPLIFSPGIMASVASSILILDLSSNQLKSLDPIAELPVLHTLMAANNRFANFESILGTLESLRHLRFLTLKGNPIASKPNYKSKIIGVVYRLEVLDGKDINDTTRVCVQKLRLMKEYRARQKEEADLMNKMRQEEEEQDHFHSHNIDLENPSEFNFSTPTRMSPLPIPGAGPGRQISMPLVPQDACNGKSSILEGYENGEPLPAQNVVIDNASYESRARNPEDDDFLIDTVVGDADKMSDMAKIIFRLSNLDEVGPGGDGENLVKMRPTNYWEFPGSSLPRECRPLSPLDGEICTGIPYLNTTTNSSYSTSAPDIIGKNQFEKKSSSGSRPKPAAPGGRRCSNNVNIRGGILKSLSEITVTASNPANLTSQFQTQRHFYGRTLSPLMELPTPESLTARDDHKDQQ